jgi:hypothetical protein
MHIAVCALQLADEAASANFSGYIRNLKQSASSRVFTSKYADPAFSA